MNEREFLELRSEQTGIKRKQESKAQRDLKAKKERIRAFRREASRLASMANKRLKRLEANDLIDSPAYQAVLVDGDWYKDHPRFQVRGKDYKQLRREVIRMNKFLDSDTSTIRGVNKVLKDMANSTGIKYSNLKDLRSKSKAFFTLASKIEQYLRTVEDMGSAIGYQKIWEQINKYVETNDIVLDSGENDVEELVVKVVKAMGIYDEDESQYDEKGGFHQTTWYKLEKD